MPSSRKGRRQQPYRPLEMDRLAGVARLVTRRGSEYSVQQVPGNSKVYVCPGCNHQIAAHTAHVVVWAINAPVGVELGVQARRHWHLYCWKSG